MGERVILATAVALSLVALGAILGGALDAVAAGVLVLALLLFVTAAFRVVDEIGRREEEPASRRHRASRRRRRRA